MPRVSETKKVSGILLAAGCSRRMGGQNKLLADFAGRPMVRHVAETMLDAGLHNLIIVIGYQAELISAALDQLSCNLVFNPQFASGQGHSVAAGIAALDEAATDAVIALGDMPLVSATILKDLVSGHLACVDHPRRITLPSREGKRGNPVIWGGTFFSELRQLRGDAGGRQVLRDHYTAHNLVECSTSAIFQDIDTLADLQSISGKHSV